MNLGIFLRFFVNWAPGCQFFHISEVWPKISKCNVRLATFGNLNFKINKWVNTFVFLTEDSELLNVNFIWLAEI